MAIKNQDDFLEELINPLAETFEQVNTDVLSVISARIKSIGAMTPTDAHKLSILIKNGDLGEIERIISDGTELSIKQVDTIVNKSATHNDELASELYSARNLPLSTIATNTSLLNVVETAKKNMVDGVVNLSKTTGFMINGKMTDISKTYNYAVNRAIFEVEQGLFDYNTSMRSVIKQMADSGVRVVDYESGYSRRLDSACSMNVMDGVRQLNANYREVQGSEFGADGIELSAHALCSEGHLPYQGKQYTNAEFENIQNSLDRPFFVMNCKHSMYPIIIGISKPVYSQNDLQDINDKSNEIVKYQSPSGKTIEKSRYEATQDQRRQEVKIRRLKDNKNQLDVLGDKIGSATYQKKIKEQTVIYKRMSEQMGISPKLERTRIVK